MQFELRYAIRYLFSKRGGLARLTTYSALFGIAFGVACLIVVQAIYSGFRDGVESRLLSQTSHITVTQVEDSGASSDLTINTLRRDSNVLGVEPVLFRSSVISHGEKTAYGLIRVRFGGDSKPDSQRGVFIGRDLADNLGAEKADKVNLLFEDAAGRAAVADVVIFGLIETGLYQYDSQIISISSDDFARLESVSAAVPNAYLVSLKRPFEAERTATNIGKLLGPAYSVTDWRSANRPLFAALSFERRIAFVVFTIMVLLASLGVAATLALLVNERRTDIAVLKTCGARSITLIKMFGVEGLLLGIGGVVLGVSLGVIACAAANTFGLVSLESEVYSISSLELMPGLLSSLVIAAGAFVLIIPSVLIPVLKASNIKPEALLRIN